MKYIFWIFKLQVKHKQLLYCNLFIYLDVLYATTAACM